MLNIVCSVAIKIPGYKETAYIDMGSLNFGFSNGTYNCIERWPDKKKLFSAKLGLMIFILWIPIIILIVSQILMYIRLKREALAHSTSTNQNRFSQLSRASKSFRTIVAVFAICTIPYGMINHLITYYVAFNLSFIMKHHKTLNETLDAFLLLMSTNCIWNALIYGKIQQHITKAWRRRKSRGESEYPLGSTNTAVSTSTVVSNTALSTSTVA